MTFQRIALDTGWQFKNASDPDSAFLDVAQFPTNIHLDLLKHGKIPDPFLDTTESAVQWVGEEAWDYRTTFAVPSDKANSGRSERAEIIFEGLDTYAAVFLNGGEVLRADNMFVHHRVDVTGRLKEGNNTLLIRFDSTFLVGKQIEKNAADKPLFCHNGDSSRLQGANAPHMRALAAGLLGDILGTHQEFVSGKVTFELFDSGGRTVEKAKGEIRDGTSAVSISLPKPELWYPRGYGPQPLYSLRASLESSITSDEAAAVTKRFGIRRVELVQRPLKNKPGTTFFFRINGTPVFSCGADWIPAESFLPRITREKYRNWVEFAAEGNHNMIRVWGGGIFEDESFYSACDELGIMIWHDFMFGCGSYPVTKDFLSRIEKEVAFNIDLLDHHPCIVLWCGNNEDHMFADRYPSGYDPGDTDPEHWMRTRWPARIIYDKILPEICARRCPDTPYHPGSPWGGRPSNDETVGDQHCWSVWMKALEMYPFQYYPKLGGRFVSEFGIKSYPAERTLAAVITDPAQRHPQSRALDAHGKSASKTPWAGDFRNIALYMFENVRHGYALGQYVYASQLVQAEAVGLAYASWRRLWRGEGREECAGVLCWQLNDCWPCVSWSLGDYYLRPKLAYYTIRRALAPLAAGVAREEVEISRRDEFTRVHITTQTRLQVWGSNMTPSPAKIDLEVRAFSVSTGVILWERHDKGVVLAANQSTDLVDIPFPDIPESSGPAIVAARLVDPDTGSIVARYADWPQPLRYLDLPKPGIDLVVEGDTVKVSASLPVKALHLSLEEEGVAEDKIKWDDNCLDLMPGDEQIIHATGLGGQKVKALHLGIAAD